jgi:hypothetical protein
LNGFQFFDQVTRVADQYNQDNQWFGFQRGGQAWSKGTWVQFIIAAWKLYQKAGTNQLQMILLGDTKIRSDAELLMNFGLVSNTNTPQEAKDIKLVEELMAKRAAIARNSIFKDPVNIMGPGSILSAQRWSPLLNDALMLGGIIGRQEFHFVLNTDEQAIWAQLTSKYIGKAELERRRAVFGAAAKTPLKPALSSEQELWLRFFRQAPRVLWENNKPRVFVRELLGLKFFGYKPVFSIYELGFCSTGGGNAPTFQNYLTGLNTVGFHLPNRGSIMRTLSEFLFNDVDALRDVGA